MGQYNEKTIRQPCYLKIMVKKDYKSTLHLLYDYATGVE